MFCHHNSHVVDVFLDDLGIDNSAASCIAFVMVDLLVSISVHSLSQCVLGKGPSLRVV